MSADLFSVAGERIALATGVPLSQAVAEVKGAPRLVESRGLFETCEHLAPWDAECLECEPALDPADAPGPFFTLADAFRPHAFLAGAPSRTSLGHLCQVCDGSPHAAIHAPPC